MFHLKDILTYKRVVIQCHDNPDPDALASAYAIWYWCTENKQEAEIVYSGAFPVQKANLTLLINLLKMPLHYLENKSEPQALGTDDLLLTVDCQYGAGNVKHIPAVNVATLDHHVEEGHAPQLSDIRPQLGSCSTLVWSHLLAAGFDVNTHGEIATALYYGLFTDTGGLSEISHPLDKDMRDGLNFNKTLIKLLVNTNLSESDLTIAGNALINRRIDNLTGWAVFEAEPCDPNILGFASDLALQVDTIKCCAVFCEISGGVKISVRSCSREVMANELASRLCEGVGSGGGHREKAGGFLRAQSIAATGLSPRDFLCDRMQNYFNEYDLIDSENFAPTLSEFNLYRKLPLPVGYVRSTDVFPAGTEFIVRSLEGDEHAVAGSDLYIMIGIQQEAYPISKERFDASYSTPDQPYVPDAHLHENLQYFPTVKRGHDDPINLLPYALTCIPTGTTRIFAKKIDRHTKVFTPWTPESYMVGSVGDYLGFREDSPQDVYILNSVVFTRTYELDS
jgi:phosphoglycolate phosphatase